jgi:type IV pilus assembly protein PilM
MANTGIGVVVGGHTVRGVAVRKKGEAYAVTRVVAAPAEEVGLADAGRFFAAKGLKGAPVTVGLTGKDVIIRYNQVPPVPDWRLKNLMKFEVLEVSGQSGGAVSADYRKLNLPDPDGTRGEDTVLVCLARNPYLEPILTSLAGAGLSVRGGCPRSVGLFTAFAVNATYREDETCLLVNVGGGGMDLAIERGGELLFARNASPGGQAYTDAIAAAFSASPAKAETMKVTKADVTPRGQARYADPTAEKIANAIVGTAGQAAQLIQSTLMIGRAQCKLPDLKVDRVLLAGGGASLKGLDAYLKQAMGVPVERFDPFQGCDLSELSDEERALLTEKPHEFATALGLAQTHLAPAAFPLEVIPDAVRRTRDFTTKGVFTGIAAVVAAGVLGIVYTSRSAATDEVKRQKAALERDEAQKVKNPEKEFRAALSRLQETREKHRRLAERAAPGVLLSDTLGLLQRGLTEHPEVYLLETSLEVRDDQPTFGFWVPKPGSQGGYQERGRSRPERSAVVKVVGKVSTGNESGKVYTEFFQTCRTGGLGKNLVVSAKTTFDTATRQFELRVSPGVSFRPKGAEAGTSLSPWLLRGAVLLPAEGGAVGEWGAVKGIDTEGVEVTVARDRIDEADWKRLLEETPKASAATAPEGNG